MNKWRFNITDSGNNDLEKLDHQIKERVIEKLKWLVKNFEYLAPIPLDEPLKGFFKLRIGSWRVVYDFESEKSLVTIYSIDNRDSVYKKLK